MWGWVGQPSGPALMDLIIEKATFGAAIVVVGGLVHQ